MDNCRICLQVRNNLVSLDDIEENVTYLEMVFCLVGKKIYMGEQGLKKICHLCKTKLKEAYDFKVLIQKSDMKPEGNLKMINFNNLRDIQIKIEINKEAKNRLIPTCLTKLFKKDDQMITYNNTVIKRLSNDSEKENKPIHVLDLLETIKNNCDDDYGLDNDIDDYSMDKESDDEYHPSKPIKPKKTKKKHNKESKVKETCNNNDICIKPVTLKNIRVIYHDPKPIVKNRKPNVKKDICPYCGKITGTLMQSHILLHIGERSFKCDICSKGFFTRSVLMTHVKRHNGVKKFKCHLCVASFINKGSLNSHIQSHGDQRNHVCNLCSKAFKGKSGLNRHLWRHNSGNKMVKCDLCNMSFFDNIGLRHHMRIHTGERPYNCEICSQPYSYKHDFNRHCLKKHGVFFKRRSVYVMNEEVLMQERALMRDILLRTQGILNDDKPLNPFEGPQAHLAFEQTLKALATRQIPVDL